MQIPLVFSNVELGLELINTGVLNIVDIDIISSITLCVSHYIFIYLVECVKY